jgi:hypothetical protein
LRTALETSVAMMTVSVVVVKRILLIGDLAVGDWLGLMLWLWMGAAR